MSEYDVPEKIARGTQAGPGSKPAKAQVRLCACGCGSNLSPKANFRQGHDQKLIGNLARWVSEGTIDKVARAKLGLADDVNDVAFINRIAAVSDALSSKFSPQLANKFYAAAERARKALAVAPKSEQSAEESLVEKVDREIKEGNYVVHSPDSPEKAPELNDEMHPGAEVRIKVGRRRYDATVHGMSQAGKVTAVRYYTPGGNEMVKTEGQFELICQIPG